MGGEEPHVIHDLKVWPEFFEALHAGKKTFEVRKNDRRFELGDLLHLQEWNPQDAMTSSGRHGYTGREITKRVTYVMHGGKFGLAEGFVVMGLGDP